MPICSSEHSQLVIVNAFQLAQRVFGQFMSALDSLPESSFGKNYLRACGLQNIHHLRVIPDKCHLASQRTMFLVEGVGWGAFLSIGVFWSIQNHVFKRRVWCDSL